MISPAPAACPSALDVVIVVDDPLSLKTFIFFAASGASKDCQNNGSLCQILNRLWIGTFRWRKVSIIMAIGFKFVELACFEFINCVGVESVPRVLALPVHTDLF